MSSDLNTFFKIILKLFSISLLIKERGNACYAISYSLTHKGEGMRCCQVVYQLSVLILYHIKIILSNDFNTYFKIIFYFSYSLKTGDFVTTLFISLLMKDRGFPYDNSPLQFYPISSHLNQ